MTEATTTMPLTVRMRRSPFFERSHAAGGRNYIVYNNMLIASEFVSPEADYRHLKSAVQLWDVGCERQVEITGPDAAKLVQMSTPRDISMMEDDQCYYLPTVDQDGCMTNDPVLLRLGRERFWLSLSDSDLLIFFKGLAAGAQLDVNVREPEVSPLGIQGPRADELAYRVWGDVARELRFFRHTRVDVHGSPMILARSGFSLQGGFELYYEGQEGGDAIWDRLMEAGQDLDIRAGCPSQTERIESGLLSYLSDITQDMTPMEAGLGRFCHLDTDTGCIGLEALRAKREPVRQLRPIRIDGAPVPPMTGFWPVTDAKGAPAGRISSSAWSFDFQCNVAIGLIDRRCWDVGTELAVDAPGGARPAVVNDGFWGRKSRDPFGS